MHISRTLITSALLASGCSVLTDDSPVKSKPNVLFIAVDDLRPALGCYGVKEAITPNIDRLASSGTLFSQHYVQVPTCGASRCSLLTGLYPRTFSRLSNHAAVRGSNALMPGPSDKARTMPELFRKNGYKTICIGKISHMPDGKVFKYNGKGAGKPELPDAWDEYATPYGKWKYGHGAFFAYGGGRHREDKSGYKPYCEFPDVADSELPDGMMADVAIEKLKEYKNKKEPFFLALGFYKPHLPFVAPKKYRDLYNDVSIPSMNGMKKGDTACWHGSGEFYNYSTNRPFKRPGKDETLSESDAQNVRKAYFACVSYVDAQIGRVLDALRKDGLDKNTIVVLWGDHGWHLGENNIWGKHSLLDKALQSTLIISAPNMESKGAISNSPACSVDIYPTLVDLCDLPFRKVKAPLDGKSLKPILNDPKKKIRDISVSFWQKKTSITDGIYRLIISKDKESDNYSFELYNHQDDPGELKNIADQNPERIDHLMSLLSKEYPQIIIRKK